MLDATNNGTGGCARARDQELAERPRWRFSAEYKLRILDAADGCREPAEIWALLWREGLYPPHLVLWRKQRAGGGRTAFGRRHGRRVPHPLAAGGGRGAQR